MDYKVLKKMNYLDKFRLLYCFNILSIPIGIVVAFNTSLWWLVLGIIWYRIVGILFVSIGLHRYFTHRSFQTGYKRHILFVIGSIISGNGSPIAFASQHIHHHKHSDKELDLHSPKDGTLHSCFSWLLNSKTWFLEEKEMKIPMFILKDRVVNFVHKYYFTCWSTISFILFLIDWKLFLFIMPFAGGLSILTSNIVVGYLAHIKLPGSYKNFDTKDDSFNNEWIQLIETAEGYHNNHHADPSNYNFARNKNEFDLCAVLIKKFFKV